MAVELGIRSPATGHTAGGGVLVLGGDQILRGLLNHLAAVAAADHGDVLAHVRDGLLDRVRMRLRSPAAATVPRAPTPSRQTSGH